MLLYWADIQNKVQDTGNWNQKNKWETPTLVILPIDPTKIIMIKMIHRNLYLYN